MIVGKIGRNIIAIMMMLSPTSNAIRLSEAFQYFWNFGKQLQRCLFIHNIIYLRKIHV